MNKARKIIGWIIIAAMLAVSVSTVVFAGYQEHPVSTLNFKTALIGKTRDYQYQNVGFKYKNATVTYASGAPVTTAYFTTKLEMATGFLGAWQLKGSVTCPVNKGDVYYGWTFQNAQEAGKTRRGYFGFTADAAVNESRNTICPTFIMYSRTY